LIPRKDKEGKPIGIKKREEEGKRNRVDNYDYDDRAFSGLFFITTLR
jgi:hypothetical protein